MAYTAEQLEAYWKKNSGMFQQALQANPSAFNIAPPKSPIQQLVSKDFWSDGAYAGMNVKQEAEARGMSNAGVRRIRRQETVGRDLAAIPTTEDMGLTDYINSTMDVTGIQPVTGGRKTKSFQDAKKAQQKGAVLNYAGDNNIPLAFMSNRDGTRDDGKGKYLWALNTGYGVDIPDGYELDGSNQPGASTPGEYVRLREEKTKEWYEDPGQIIKAGVTTALGAGVGSAVSAAAGLSGLAAGATSGAANTAVTSAITGQDLTVEGLLKGAATGAAGAGIGQGMEALQEVPVIGRLGTEYLADDFGGAFTRGAVNDSVVQLINDGSLSIEDALKSGLINMGQETAKDIFEDVRDTRDLQKLSAEGTLDGRHMVVDDVNRLHNTTDAYGLLGNENAFLNKVLGADIGYIPTDWLGTGMDVLFGSGERDFIMTPGGDKLPVYTDADGTTFAIDPVSGTKINAADVYMGGVDGHSLVGEQYKGLLADGMFAADPTNLDLRFFDRANKRTLKDTGASGIYEDPGAAATVRFPTGAGTGGGSATQKGAGVPGSSTSLSLGDTRNTDITDETFGLPTRTERLENQGDLFEDTDLTGGKLTLGDGGYPEGDYIPEPEPTGWVPGDEGDEVVTGPYVPGGEDTGGDDIPGDDDIPGEKKKEPEIPGDEGGGGAIPGAAERARRKLKEGDPELFRLARIMQVEGLPQSVYEAAIGRINGILKGRQGSDYEGDVTRGVDPLSGRYVQRVKGERGASRRKTMLRELKEKEMTT